MISYNINLRLTLAASLLLSLSLSLSSCMNRDPSVTENGATFYVDDIKSSFAANNVRFGDVNQKFINMTACLKDNAQKSIIMNVPFAIYADNVEIIHINYETNQQKSFQTDRDGCITWQELFEFNPKTSERQISLSRNFKALSGHSGSVNAQLAYNPWHDELKYLKLGLKAQAKENAKIVYSSGMKLDRVNSYSGGSSSSQIDIQGKLQSSAELVPLDISSMSMVYSKRDFDQYEVSPTLGLTIAHQYRLHFAVSALRQTLDRGAILEAINFGHFRFNFVLLKEGYDSKSMKPEAALKYVVGSSTFDSKGTVGRFDDLITLKFDNIAALASRMTGILTIEPIDQTETYKATSFEGVVTPISGGASQSLVLVPTKIDGLKLARHYAGFREESFKLKGLDVLTAHGNFKAANPASGNQPQNAITTYNFASLLKSKTLPSPSDTTFAQALCFSYFNNSMTDALVNAYSACRNSATSANPEKMMLGVLRDFVEKINDPKPIQVNIPHVENIVIASGLNFSDSSSQEQGIGQRKDNGLYGGLGAEFNVMSMLEKIPVVGTIVKALNIFNFSASTGMKMSWNKDWYYSSGLTQAQSKSTGISTARGEVVTSESFKFQVKASTKTCLMITPSPELLKLMPTAGAPEGKFVCADQLETGTRDEVYYFISQTTGSSSSPMSDSMSSNDNPLRMFVRGPRTFDLFSKLLSHDKFDLKLQKMSVEDRTDKLKDQLNQYVTQEFPGMITPAYVPTVLPVAGMPSGGPTGPKKHTWFGKKPAPAVQN